MDLTKLAIDQLIKMALHNPAFKQLVIKVQYRLPDSGEEDRRCNEAYMTELTISTLDKKAGYTIVLYPNEDYSLLEIVQKALAAGVLESEDKK